MEYIVNPKNCNLNVDHQISSTIKYGVFQCFRSVFSRFPAMKFTESLSKQLVNGQFGHSLSAPFLSCGFAECQLKQLEINWNMTKILSTKPGIIITPSGNRNKQYSTVVWCNRGSKTTADSHENQPRDGSKHCLPEKALNPWNHTKYFLSKYLHP
jgi:hypothetical protein